MSHIAFERIPGVCVERVVFKIRTNPERSLAASYTMMQPDQDRVGAGLSAVVSISLFDSLFVNP